VVAAIIGDSVGFEVGKRYGERLLTLRVFRRRRAALDRALIGLEKRGPAYVFIGRFTAFLRAVMPGLAGIAKMRYRRFLLANAAGGLVWGVSFTLLGYFAGNALTKIEKYASWGATTILVVLIVVVVTLHLRRKRKEAALEVAAEDRSTPGEH
jgi:membrane protein DedA with SNARE-associated domain